MGTSRKKLDIGCGTAKKPGYIGMDIVKLPGVDVVADINEKLPFKSNEFDEVKLTHVLEHVKQDKFIDIMRELHRITKPNGVIKIESPYYTSKDAYSDPTHTIFFTEHSFRYFTKDYIYNFYSDVRFEILKIKFNYQSPIWKYNPLRRILRHFFMNIVSSIEFELRPIKKN